MITSVFECNEAIRVARCSRNYSLLAYNGSGGEDEDVLSVCRNLKIFCETAPWLLSGTDMNTIMFRCTSTSGLVRGYNLQIIWSAWISQLIQDIVNLIL